MSISVYFSQADRKVSAGFPLYCLAVWETRKRGENLAFDFPSPNNGRSESKIFQLWLRMISKKKTVTKNGSEIISTDDDRSCLGIWMTINSWYIFLG